MSHRECGDRKITCFKKHTGPDLIQAQRHWRLVAAQNDAIQQVMHSIERGTPAKDIEFIDRFPAQERGHQSAKPEDVIEMTVRKKDAGEILEARARLQDLALRALTAVDQKTILIVLDDLRGKTAFRGRCGGGSAKEENFEQVEPFVN
jgi:hypothetical protein